MAELTDFEPEPGNATTLRDQRRPGRREDVDPALIPLLRGQVPEVPVDTVAPGDVTPQSDRRISLSAARGIFLGALLGSLIWVGIAAGFWFYFHG